MGTYTHLNTSSDVRVADTPVPEGGNECKRTQQHRRETKRQSFAPKTVLDSHPLCPIAWCRQPHLTETAVMAAHCLPPVPSLPQRNDAAPPDQATAHTLTSPPADGWPSQYVSRQRISVHSQQGGPVGAASHSCSFAGLLRSSKPNPQEHGSRAACHQKGHQPM